MDINLRNNGGKKLHLVSLQKTAPEYLPLPKERVPALPVSVLNHIEIITIKVYPHS